MGESEKFATDPPVRDDGNHAEPEFGEVNEFDGELGHAMQSYLRQLGRIPKLSESEQQELGAEIMRADACWREALYGFTGMVDAHLAMLAKCDPTALDELIMPSCLLAVKPETAIPAWRNRLAGLADALHNAFENGESAKLETLRREAIAELNLFQFPGDVLDRLQRRVLAEMPSPDAPAEVKNIFAALAGQSGYTVEEYVRQTAAVHAARASLGELRQRMVEANLRLVVSIVNRYHYRQMPASDLVQEGNLGLIRSLEKFDFRLGHKFSTYASWWIKQSIGRAVSEQFRIIRIPAHMITTINAINRAEQRFICEHGREPEVEEIAAMLEMPTPRVSAIRKMARQAISLQSPLTGEDPTATLEDVIADEQAFDPSRAVSERGMMVNLELLLSSLSAREREILVMRFGLMGHTVMTLQEISEHFHISRERVRQLELQTLNKLRTPENRQILNKELFF